MARSDPQVNIRMPAELKANLEQAAETSGRSLNSEIVSRLQKSFEFNPDETIPSEILAELKGLAEKFATLAKNTEHLQEQGKKSTRKEKK